MDLVVGLGEIGKPIKKLLEMRGFKVQGTDIKQLRPLEDNYDFIHVCFPYSQDFENEVKTWKLFGQVIVHSTVKPGTCDRLGVIYSPIRGIHARMFDDLEGYTKYYSGNFNKEFEKRFVKCHHVPSAKALETTKIIVDTTYYGWLIAFRKYVDKNYEVYWSFAMEIHDNLKNRPIMYNDNNPIGGHCVVENLELIDDKLFSELIK